MSNIWFSSDQHFYHKNILKFQPHTRMGLTDLDEMNEIIIENHNGVVKPEDTIFYVGDFSFGDAKQTRNIIRRLNGNKILILGNHDHVIEDNRDIQLMFSSVHTEYTLKIDKKTSVFMHHFPFHIWEKAHYGTFHVHGHCHGGLKQENMRRLDIGIDNRPEGDMMPWSWDEVYATIKDKAFKIHHGD